MKEKRSDNGYDVGPLTSKLECMIWPKTRYLTFFNAIISHNLDRVHVHVTARNIEGILEQPNSVEWLCVSVRVWKKVFFLRQRQQLGSTDAHWGLGLWLAGTHPARHGSVYPLPSSHIHTRTHKLKSRCRRSPSSTTVTLSEPQQPSCVALCTWSHAPLAQIHYHIRATCSATTWHS